MLYRILFALTVPMLFAALTLTGYAETPISPEKAVVIGYTEDFFLHNFRDFTMRKSLEWSDVKTDDNGNRTIQYRFEALVWDKNRSIFCMDFTFGADGRYVSHSNVKGFPKPVAKPDVSTVDGVKALVEKFFSRNYRDITARKAIKWGDLEKRDDGSVAITYRYEAVIWDKDKIVQEQRFIFDKDGEFIKVETVEKVPGDADKPKEDGSSVSKPFADQFFQLITEEKFGAALDRATDEVREAISAEGLEKVWNELRKNLGKFEEVTKTDFSKPNKYNVFIKECRFEGGVGTIRIVVDEDNKIAGFFIMKAESTVLYKPAGQAGKYQ
jgi:hypothetical protein